MKHQYSQNFSFGEVITLKDENFLSNQRIAGKVTAGAISLLQQQVKKQTNLSMIELSNLAEQYILDHHCTPTFKHYKGHNYKEFPAAVCISVKKMSQQSFTLVHGIPTDYHLQDGDLVSFDLGATFKGAIGDSATTLIFGQAKSEIHTKLIETTQQCLTKAIQSIKIGNRLGCIGNAIYKHANNQGFNVITNYGGHGISMTKDGEGIPHSSPFVANRSMSSEGIRIVSGLTLAIEPLLCIGSPKTNTMNDGWSVETENINSHEEHTIFINSNGVEILTDRE